jgi:hypothetical protein
MARKPQKNRPLLDMIPFKKSSGSIARVATTKINREPI